MKKKVLALVLAIVVVAALCIGLVACNDGAIKFNETFMPEWDEEYATLEVPADFKFGLICLHGESSNYDKNFIESARKAFRELGLPESNLIIKTDIKENEECTTAARELVQQGCDIIFADSFGHEPYMSKVAAEAGNENIKFCHATGTTAHNPDAPANLYNAFASIYEGRYLAGIVAGMKLNQMIAAGKFKAEDAKIGYVGAFPYAEVKSGYTSFFLGARSVCPTVTMEVQFTSSWFDKLSEKSTAQALITRGCKLISQHADSDGAPNACEEAGVPNVSYNGSMIQSCSKTFLVSSRIDWAPYFKYVIAQTVNNKEIEKDWVGTIETGSVALTNLNADTVAPGTLQAVLKARAELVKGTRYVFDCSTFTVTGKNFDEAKMKVDAQGHLTSYKADVNTDAAFTPDTEAIEKVGDKYIFMESDAEGRRSAPYFDITIDGITLLN